MSSIRGGGGAYQYPQDSRPNNQPMNYGNNPTNQSYSGPQSLYVERRSTNPALTAPASRTQYHDTNTNTNTQDSSIPQSLYVQRRSTNPVPVVRPNQPQHVEPKKQDFGYPNTRGTQAQASNTYQYQTPGTPTRNVNPALTINPSGSSQSRYAINGKEGLFVKKETRGEIDDAPIIDPSAFQYLNMNDRKGQKKAPSAANDSGIDSRPIINLDAVTQLERRRQQQIEKNNRLRGDDGSGSGIDGRPIVDANAFHHIEVKKNNKKDNDQQGQGVGSGIDDRPITSPDAFKYLEGRREQKSSNASQEPAVDSRPIISPDAFKYLEKRSANSSKDKDESGIDYKPIVNPDAFRYLEQRGPPPRRDVESGIDTTSMVNPNAFQYIERKGALRPEITESSIDYRPIVNPKAFKWVEKKDPKPRNDDGPDVDERSYVNPQAFQNIDRRPGKKSDICEPEIDTRSFILDRNPNALAHLERQSTLTSNDKPEGGIDQRSYVDPNAFKYLEGVNNDSPKTSVHSSTGASIDTKSYVNTDAFRHLEGRERPRTNDDDHDQAIDDRSFVPSAAFRHLEFSGERINSGQNDYSTHGQSDF